MGASIGRTKVPHDMNGLRSVFVSWLLVTSWIGAPHVAAQPPSLKARPLDANLQADRLVAWCIVPFDASRRTPAQRAQMLKQLGMTRCAYDWRQEHVASFEQEILEYKKHGIEFFAFWDTHPDAFALFRKHKIHPQIWRMMPNPAGDQEAKVAAAVAAMAPLAKSADELGCKLGIYNHGGWNGQPENMIAVCERLREMGHANVGIVYNFHHGHEHIPRWKQLWEQMQPMVLCLNINGMNAQPQPKILGLGQGRHELAMLQVVRESNYRGPIGILDHRSELDSKESLQENLDGLQWLRAELKDPGSGGAKPTQPTKPTTAAAGAFEGRKIVDGKDAYRTPPLTLDCQVTLPAKQRYNILIACDTKASSNHWEVFTMPRSGHLTAYLPGCVPDHVRSTVDICDGKLHRIGMVYEPTRVRLFVDGKSVADSQIKPVRHNEVPGGLGLGRLVEGGIGCDGHIHWIHLVSGVAVPTATEMESQPPQRTPRTVGLWDFPVTSAAKIGRKPLPYSPALVAELVADAAKHGDAMRGAQVFSAAKFACLSCHRVYQHGGTVGPELAKLKKRTSTQLVESVFWPRREVKDEYNLWHVLTDDGQQQKGYQVVEQSSETELTLKDPANGKTITVPRDAIERMQPTGTLMPDGLAQAMTRQQQLDLLAFLSALVDPATPKTMQEHFAMAVKHAHSHAPANFPLTRDPLVPEDWPSWRHHVNRDRIYDFYSKQAEFFRTAAHRPMVVGAFPGLDGGRQGHWGNQDDTTWQDDRWNDVRLGSVHSGIFRGGGRTTPRGVCLQLGDKREVSACFNPDTLTYDVVWKGGFVSFSKFRHGFLDGLKMVGKPEPYSAKLHGSKPTQPFEYHGFYRQGPRTIFAYRIGDVEYLDAPWAKDGEFVRDVTVVDPAGSHPLRSLAEGVQRQWPQVMERPVHQGSQREDRPYVVDTFELPTKNPWNALLFIGGHDFLSDGSVLVSTMHGDVWRVKENPLKNTATWRRIASGLHHPQGLVVVDDAIYVQGRDQMTRLHDLNGDEEIDFYECFSNAFTTSAAGHDFICGLQRDAQGRFYTATGNQGLVRISADGETAEVLATGFRNPDGLGLTPDGLVTVPCSEGSWTPASQVCAVRINGETEGVPFFGLGGPKGGRPELPLVYLPRGLDNSSGEQVYIDSERWGPLQGQMLHLSFGAGQHFLLLRDEVDGQLQGAVVPLSGEFLSGAHRGRFHPKDGQLYVSGMGGWGSYTPDDGCLQRVRYTGQQVQLPAGFHVHQNGVMVRFTSPVDAEAVDPRQHFAQCWNYRYSGAYGSPEYSTTHPGVVGHDTLAIAAVHRMQDGRSVFLEIPDLQPCSQLHLRLRPQSDSPCDLFATVHRLDEPFEGFAGYRPVEKIVAAHPMDVDLAMAAKRKPNPWTKKIKGARVVRMETGKNLTYVTRRLEVKAGEPLEFVLVNPDVVPHNWALIAPDSLPQVGDMANRLIADPDAFAMQYIPPTDQVLVHTDVVGPGAEFRIYFRAPKKPGRYPYLCTFPGHWMVMNGEMVVKP